MSYMSYISYMRFFMNHLNSLEFVLNITFFVFKHFDGKSELQKEKY